MFVFDISFDKSFVRCNVNPALPLASYSYILTSSLEKFLIDLAVHAWTCVGYLSASSTSSDILKLHINNIWCNNLLETWHTIFNDKLQKWKTRSHLDLLPLLTRKIW
ncbi:hypothetical protein C0J52_12189 [Blattella germanica]|nr:hypothetical protein C0J52_12189 [Blattella germanica]